MWMVLVVVLDPKREHLQHGCGIWSGLDPGVVALEGFDEGLADAVALGASHRGKAGNEAKCGGELQCFLRGVGGTVVSQPLNLMRRRVAAKRCSTQASIRSRTISP